MIGFNTLSKDDQKLVASAMKIASDETPNMLEFDDIIRQMSKDAQDYLIELLESHVPDEYKGMAKLIQLIS